MASICYRQSTVMIPSKDVLYVINHMGTFTIRARGIDRLHSALSPFLSAGIEESALLESLGSSQRRMVETYLHELQEIQAFGSPRKELASPSTERTPDMLDPRVRAGLVAIGEQQVFVSLDGSSTVASVSNVPRLLFVNFAEAGRLMLEWGHQAGTLILVAEKDTPKIVSDMDINRRPRGAGR
jgi:hypothetical protein